MSQHLHCLGQSHVTWPGHHHHGNWWPPLNGNLSKSSEIWKASNRHIINNYWIIFVAQKHHDVLKFKNPLKILVYHLWVDDCTESSINVKIQSKGYLPRACQADKHKPIQYLPIGWVSHTEKEAKRIKKGGDLLVQPVRITCPGALSANSALWSLLDMQIFSRFEINCLALQTSYVNCEARCWADFSQPFIALLVTS